VRRSGWTILFHPVLIQQLDALSKAQDRARQRDPEGWQSNANVRTLAALLRLMLEVIPRDPGAAAYRQGNTLGPENRAWRLAKFGGRMRLFFRYDSATRIVVYAWVNDERSLRKSGGRNDPYAVFSRMLERGSPPSDWQDLVKEARPPPETDEKGR
jgi:toxin YhaV